MPECRNWQTSATQNRVPLACGFESHLWHHTRKIGAFQPLYAYLTIGPEVFTACYLIQDILLRRKIIGNLPGNLRRLPDNFWFTPFQQAHLFIKQNLPA